jgi:hypothetical protein
MLSVKLGGVGVKEEKHDMLIPAGEHVPVKLPGNCFFTILSPRSGI